MTQSVLLVDDHPIVRGAIRSLIESISEDVHVWVAGSLADAFQHLSTQPAPDIAIVDLGLPDACGTATIQAFRRRAAGIPVLAMSGFIDSQTAAGLRAAGATGLLSKSFSADEWKATICHALAKRPGEPPTVLSMESRPSSPGARIGLEFKRSFTKPPPIDYAAGRHLQLTARQREVLKLILQGLPNKAICRETGMAEGTVKTHVSAVLRALRVTTRAQAVVAALRAGIDIGKLL